MPKDPKVEFRQYGTKEVFHFDDHAVALVPWSHLRAAAGLCPLLLTLDYYTDADSAFGRAAYFESLKAQVSAYRFVMQWIKEMNCLDPKTIEVAVNRLENDEHISAAIYAQIIDAALIISAIGITPTRSVEFERVRLNTPLILPDRPHNYSVPDSRIYILDTQEFLHAGRDHALEDKLLSSVVIEANDMLRGIGRAPLSSQCYILDIDLDYFQTRRSLHPTTTQVFDDLLKKAFAITVAREPNCVRNHNTDVTVEDSLSALESHFVRVLTGNDGIKRSIAYTIGLLSLHKDLFKNTESSGVMQKTSALLNRMVKAVSTAYKVKELGDAVLKLIAAV